MGASTIHEPYERRPLIDTPTGRGIRRDYSVPSRDTYTHDAIDETDICSKDERYRISLCSLTITTKMG